MTATSWTTSTPAGPLAVLADVDGVVIGSGWSTVEQLAAWTEVTDTRPATDLGSTSRAVEAYLAGDLAALDDVPVQQAGGPFTRHAWDVLRAVPPGVPITYTRFAELCGRPTAVRAAGSACGRNRIALFVPCHRVLRTDGTLGGFRWGLEVKRWLLDHERAAARATEPV